MKTDVIALTAEMIHAGRAGSGGWTREQVELLRVPWPPPAGWIAKLAGTVIDRQRYERFLSLKGSATRRRSVSNTPTMFGEPESEVPCD